MSLNNDKENTNSEFRCASITESECECDINLDKVVLDTHDLLQSLETEVCACVDVEAIHNHV